MVQAALPRQPWLKLTIPARVDTLDVVLAVFLGFCTDFASAFFLGSGSSTYSLGDIVGQSGSV
jgi:hypothetical protein